LLTAVNCYEPNRTITTQLILFYTKTEPNPTKVI